MTTEEQYKADIAKQKSNIKAADERGDTTLREQLKQSLKRYRKETVYC